MTALCPRAAERLACLPFWSRSVKPGACAPTAGGRTFGAAARRARERTARKRKRFMACDKDSVRRRRCCAKGLNPSSTNLANSHRRTMTPVKSPLPLMMASREEQIFPRLTPEQIARVAAHGRTRTVQRGEVLVETGQQHYPFFVVTSAEL